MDRVLSIIKEFTVPFLKNKTSFLLLRSMIATILKHYRNILLLSIDRYIHFMSISLLNIRMNSVGLTRTDRDKRRNENQCFHPMWHRRAIHYETRNMRELHRHKYLIAIDFVFIFIVNTFIRELISTKCQSMNATTMFDRVTYTHLRNIPTF